MDLIILKLLFKYSIYNKYYKVIDLNQIPKNLEKLYISINEFHKKYPNQDIKSSDEFAVFFFSLFPAMSEKDRQNLEPLFEKLEKTTVTDEIAEEYFQNYEKARKAAQLALLALQVSEGSRDYSELSTFDLSGFKGIDEVVEEEDFVVDSGEGGRPPTGLRWPWKCLNTMMGSLRRGHFGFIFARPESGKTTLIADFSAFTLKSKPDAVICWFNNEQPGLEVLHRCIQSYFGITLNDLYDNKAALVHQYYQETGHRLKIYDDAGMDKARIERICKKINPSLIIFDQIDKLKGFASDRKDLELGDIYQWARELAKRYGPVIGVCQAGGSAEGKKWLTMEDVNNSKTAKQGEADWILGIGKSHQEGMGNIRHLHLCKNKLPGDEDTDSNQRHGKADIVLKAEIGRYEDINHG